jgi:hypothetical protein
MQDEMAEMVWPLISQDLGYTMVEGVLVVLITRAITYQDLLPKVASAVAAMALASIYNLLRPAADNRVQPTPAEVVVVVGTQVVVLVKAATVVRVSS